jgi:hypothetical protein
MELWIEQVPTLGKKSVEIRPAILEPCPTASHTETHACRLRLDAQFVHQSDKIRIGAIVEDDKARVYRVGLALNLNVDGVGVTSDVVVCFVQGNVVVAMQMITRYQSRNTATDDRDFHRLPCCWATESDARGMLWFKEVVVFLASFSPEGDDEPDT